MTAKMLFSIKFLIPALKLITMCSEKVMKKDHRGLK